MIEIVDLVQDMFLVAVTALVPLFVAGVLGALVGGLAVAYFGIQDQSIAAITRGAAVALAVFITGASIAGHVQRFTTETWSGLETLGHEPVASLPDTDR